MFKTIVKPTLTLVLICVLVSALLAATYNLAGIAELTTAGLSSEQLNESMAEALPGSVSLKRAKVSPEDEGVLAVYADEGGAGSAFYILTKGYGGDLKILIGIGPDGAIAGAKAIENQETSGIGSKALKDTFLNQFVGKSGEIVVKKAGGDVDAVSRATVSSRAVGDAMNRALYAYEQVKGELNHE